MCISIGSGRMVVDPLSQDVLLSSRLKNGMLPVHPSHGCLELAQCWDLGRRLTDNRPHDIE